MKEYYIEKAQSFIRYHDFPGNDIPIMFIHGLGCGGHLIILKLQLKKL